MKVRWSSQAQQHLREIVTFIAKDSSKAAIKESIRIVEASQQLGESPLLGHRMPAYPHDEIYEWLVRPYRLIYLVNNEEIVMVAIMHYRQQLPQSAAQLRGLSSAKDAH